MLLKDFYRFYVERLSLEGFCDWCRCCKGGDRFTLGGLSTSAKALVLAAVEERVGKQLVVLCNDEDRGAYLFNDLSKLTDRVCFLPPTQRRDASATILRTEVLNRLVSGGGNVVVSCVDALMELVPDVRDLERSTLQLRVGEVIGEDFLQERLGDYGFERVDFVYAPGQFSVRGSIVDVFSFTNDFPYRIDLFGDEVESIRTFDIERQLSLEKVDAIALVPNMAQREEVKWVKVFDFLGREDTIFMADGLDNTLLMASDGELADVRRMGSEEFWQEVMGYALVDFHKRVDERLNGVDFCLQAQPLFHKNFDLLRDNLLQLKIEGYRLFVSSDSDKQIDRIRGILKELGCGVEFEAVKGTLHEGFVDVDAKVCLYTDHQVFDRFHKYSIKSEHVQNGKAAMMLKELNQIQIGDYIVHVDHGIGRFGGLLKMELNGKEQEVIKLIYKNDDVIFVSIHSLHRISKYKGKDGVQPVVSKLGSGAWERMKERTKCKVKDIARDLIQLYAKRMKEKGFAFSPDSYLQKELEASFLYEDTPDQLKVTADVKRDMESETPMDRLVCGDVGFGKTEIAIRAAFKAVTDGKQVAVLVPTTVLALQHFKTFSERLKDMPCRVEFLSRMRKGSDVKGILKDTTDGKVDILIGTHRLIGKDVKFKDLGLLVIDEEQKFGVAVKEKLKQLKVNVDTLTLTATPIPRTLQFSLMGARDLSVITTPPPNRYPVYTELCTWNDSVIKSAIERELNRNGQVFFIHNRVQTMGHVEALLRGLMPNLRIAVAHGQMAPELLEQRLLDFIDYEYDVLIATTVVESGIDIPNVNTIIINAAQTFGLTDLHQLRGRVGRSNRKGYCYLLAPPLKELGEDAKRRLQAIETYAELGSGFNIAMQDLDIRGAGNMLGAEQSGFIADIGYETYQRILEEAVMELRTEEFSDLYKENPEQEYVTDCHLESDLELLLPETYVENVAERMSLYRDLDSVNDVEQLEQWRKNLEDRFGKVPQQVEDLMEMVKLRWVAKKLGFEKLSLKGNKMICYLVSKKGSSYYESELFERLINFVIAHPNMCQMKEANDKRMVVIKPIGSVAEAYALLEAIAA